MNIFTLPYLRHQTPEDNGSIQSLSYSILTILGLFEGSSSHFHKTAIHLIS